MESAAASGAKPRARDLAAATPATRNRYLDLLRVVSIGVVVLGHWTMAVLGFRDGAFTGSNLLELNPDLQLLTWLFQVMPLFFIVGGFTNGASWASSRARGTRYADWLRARSARLIRPALWFVGFWTLLPVLGVTIGLLSPGMARIGGQEVSLPLWFLTVYLSIVVAIPPLYALHERFGARLFWALVIGAFVVDNVHFGLDVSAPSAVNYLLVWLAVVQLGFLWRDGTLASPRWLQWAMVFGALGALVVMTGWFDYPISMIGLTHAPRSNVQPPTLALLALGIGQCGTALLLQDIANRWLQRARVWVAVIVANSMIMTLYLWNMSAVVLAAVLLFPTGIAPQPEPLSTSWWVLRPAWYVVCAICLLPFLFGFRWAERSAGPPPSARKGWLGAAVVVGGTIAAAAGLALLAARAFPVPGEEFALPMIGVALVVLGAALVRVDPIAPLRHPADDA